MMVSCGRGGEGNDFEQAGTVSPAAAAEEHEAAKSDAQDCAPGGGLRLG